MILKTSLENVISKNLSVCAVEGIRFLMEVGINQTKFSNLSRQLKLCCRKNSKWDNKVKKFLSKFQLEFNTKLIWVSGGKEKKSRACLADYKIHSKQATCSVN